MSETMTDIEIKQYDILRYLNQNHVRQNINLEDEALRVQFEFTDTEFKEVLNDLLLLKYVDRRDNSCLKITERGQEKFSVWHSEFVKNNPIASQLQDEIQTLTIENLRLQNKSMKRKIPYAITGVICGFLISFGLQFTQYSLFNKSEKMDVNVILPKTIHDTIFIKYTDAVLMRKDKINKTH